MNYSVLGAAKSGLAAAFLARRLGDNVFISEKRSAQEMSGEIHELNEAGIEFEMGGHTSRVLENVDCIITSPGVRPTTDILLEAASRGIPVISELEFAHRHTSNSIVAITGTNGKTTTTALLEYILKKGGRNAIACGNIGTPLSSLVLDSPNDLIYVVECSSYQLDRTVNFKPEIAIMLNITPDHLLYHGSVDKYIEAKWKISSNQSSTDRLILCADDAVAATVPSHIQSRILTFSVKHPVQPGMYVHNGNLVFAEQHREEILMHSTELRLPGIHNAYNSMAAALAARAFEIRNEDLRDSLMSFSGVEHRLESVRVVDQVEYINDSKATNVNATWYALQSFNKPIILIAGGRGDNNDYASLDDMVRKNVKCVIAIGEEQDVIFEHFCTIIRCIRASTLEQAVMHAREQAMGDDVVLFSPACKSFDMFMNYEHRGHAFKEIVNAL